MDKEFELTVKVKQSDALNLTEHIGEMNFTGPEGDQVDFDLSYLLGGVGVVVTAPDHKRYVINLFDALQELGNRLIEAGKDAE